jgi:hypothetical protein
MTEHLPECCFASHGESLPALLRRHAFCICNQLRVCEERVRAEYGSLRTMHACADLARANGIKAAREAVEVLPEYALRDTCVSAIDALKEKK